jgi:hypothetical protein
MSASFMTTSRTPTITNGIVQLSDDEFRILARTAGTRRAGRVESVVVDLAQDHRALDALGIGVQPSSLVGTAGEHRPADAAGPVSR